MGEACQVMGGGAPRGTLTATVDSDFGSGLRRLVLTELLREGPTALALTGDEDRHESIFGLLLEKTWTLMLRSTLRSPVSEGVWIPDMPAGVVVCGVKVTMRVPRVEIASDAPVTLKSSATPASSILEFALAAFELAERLDPGFCPFATEITPAPLLRVTGSPRDSAGLIGLVGLEPLFTPKSGICTAAALAAADRLTSSSLRVAATSLFLMSSRSFCSFSLVTILSRKFSS